MFVFPVCRLVSRRCHIISTIHQLSPAPLQNRACAIYAHGSSIGLLLSAIRSSSVNIFSPLLCAVDVSLLRSSICRPLPSGGITRLLRYYGSIRLPASYLPSLPLFGCRGILPFSEEAAGSHELPVSPHGLRPRRRVCSLAFAVAALLTSVVSKTSSSSISHISGLYPFNLSACGLCACLPTLKVGNYSPSSKASYPVVGWTFRRGLPTHWTTRHCSFALTGVTPVGQILKS